LKRAAHDFAGHIETSFQGIIGGVVNGFLPLLAIFVVHLLRFHQATEGILRAGEPSAELRDRGARSGSSGNRRLDWS